MNVVIQKTIKTFYYIFLPYSPVAFALIIFQEVQRNGKAGIPAGRWPSLLSLTCPRSSGSGSGSELSLSSACSEYSSGSHTWAEGRGSSKQVGFIHLKFEVYESCQSKVLVSIFAAFWG